MPPKASQPKAEPELAESFRIFGVQADNFMRLRSASIQFDPAGNLAIVSGENDMGKTSLLRAIWVALGGPKVAPRDPVHGDADKAEIVLDLVPTDDPTFESPKRIRVSRTVDASGKWSLKLHADGRTNPWRSPQALLDEFFNHLAFDPSEFLRMKPEKQAAVLVSLAGVEDQVAALQARRQTVYDQRTSTNSLIRNAQATLDRLPAPKPGGNTQEVSAADVLAELDARRETIRTNHQQREDLQTLYTDHAKLKEAIQTKEEELARVQLELKALQNRKAEQQEKGRVLKAAVAASVDPPVTDLETRLEEVDRLNKEAREAVEYRKAKDAVDAHQKVADSLTTYLAGIDAQVRDVLVNSKLPVKGIEIHADGSVWYGAHPFEQASSARRLEISLAMGAAMHPRLKFLALQEASMMTESTRDRVKTWAAKHGFFVLMELATTERIGINIVDGEVDVTPPEAEEAAAPASATENAWD